MRLRSGSRHLTAHSQDVLDGLELTASLAVGIASLVVQLGRQIECCFRRKRVAAGYHSIGDRLSIGGDRRRFQQVVPNSEFGGFDEDADLAAIAHECINHFESGHGPLGLDTLVSCHKADHQRSFDVLKSLG